MSSVLCTVPDSLTQTDGRYNGAYPKRKGDEDYYAIQQNSSSGINVYPKCLSYSLLQLDT
jgi:hypothetical protein